MKAKEEHKPLNCINRMVVDLRKDVKESKIF